MKRHIAALSISLAGLAGLSGCGKEGTTGGPGAGNPDKPLVGRPENTFALTTSAVTLKVSGTVESSVGIKRGSGFDQDVTVEFGDVPKGITVAVAKDAIPNKASDVKFTVVSSDSATPGEYTVKVVGKPASGEPSNADFKLTVKPRASFAIDPPGNALWSAGIKQGETKQFSFGIGRDRDFADDVTLRFDGLPKGIVIEPATVGVKGTEKEAKVAIKAADDAAEGSHVVKVTGTPARGEAVTKDMTLTVSKK